MEERKIHQINTLNGIIEILEKNLKISKTNFNQKINLYGIINYSRTQYFPELSSYITGNEKYSDIFFNYTSIESMILDIFSVIESDLVLVLEESLEYDSNKMEELLNFSIKLLKILLQILNTKYERINNIISDNEYQKLNIESSDRIFKLQNGFYTLVYDEKIDSRIQ
ncbi:MAG: hypothetical protein E7Z84_08330 [Methanosphaera stadtmanae]|nr:hypothetical protein [Methanosphaera stadtmanae]